MKDRFSIVGKWEDNWFMNLPPHSKLLFTYLCDRCDVAGIIEINYRVFELHLGLKKLEIRDALLPLKTKIITDKKSKIWVTTHLFWQRYLPLVKGIEEHDWIINRLNSHLEKFNNAKEITDILSNVVIETQEQKNNTRSSNKKRFVQPDYEVFKDYYIDQKKDATEDSIKNLYDYYISCGWKVGNKPMKDWTAAIRNAIRKEKKGSKFNKNNPDKPNKTDISLSVSNAFSVKKT